MKKLMVVCISVFVLLLTTMILFTMRYQVVTAGGETSGVYKLDRFTGEVTWIRGVYEIRVQWR